MKKIKYCEQAGSELQTRHAMSLLQYNKPVRNPSQNVKGAAHVQLNLHF